MTLDRPYIFKELLSIIACFANKERQEQAWLWGRGDWGCDYDETYCMFNDMVEGIFNDGYKLYGISETQYYMLKKFSEVIFDFPENNPHEFLETPEWKLIRKMAQDIIDAFNYKDE